MDAGPWPESEPSSHARKTLTCYYYPRVMIKEYDIGGSGAVGLSMLSVSGEPPACKPSRQSGERVIDVSEWEGYLEGVKDALVFFGPPDDFNGHSPFAVFHSVSGKKLFEDSAYGGTVPSSSYRASRLQILSMPDAYVLRYLRVADADCNLHSEGAACWKKIEAELGLQSDMPACTGYDHIAELVGTDDVESVIAYPVEVTLSPRPTTRVLAGPARCWAAQ